MQNVKNMTFEEKDALVTELMPFFVKKLMNTTEVITNNGERAVKIPVRFINSNQVSTHSREELNGAIEDANSATEFDELKVATVRGLRRLEVILVGD